MKSMLPNNFKNPGSVDKSSSASSDLGNIGTSLGKKDSSKAGSVGFADMLMQAMDQEKNASVAKEPLKAPANPTLPANPVAPKVADRQTVDRVERDMADAKASRPNERPSVRDRDDVKKDNDNDPKVKTSPKHDVADRLKDKSQSTSRDVGATKASAPASAAVAQELRPLKLAVGNKNSADAMAGNNAMLAFVTGRLDRLDPDSIPGIITGNPFLKQVAATDEVADMMLQPMPVADLCKLFEIDQTVVNKAVANGLDVSAMVSPKDFLAAVGVDPGRVTSELQMMQQKLPLEGVKSYVDRARAMADKAAKANHKVGEDVAGAVGVATATGTDLMSGQALANAKKDDELGGLHSADHAPQIGMAVPPVQAPAVPNANVQQNLANKPEIATSSKVNSAAQVKSGVAKPQFMSSSDDLIESMLADRSAALPSAGQVMGASVQTLDVTKSIGKDMDLESATKGVSSDPFARLGAEMKPYDLNTTVFQPLTVSQSMSSLEEQLAANGFALKQSMSNVKDSGIEKVDSESLRELSIGKSIDFKGSEMGDEMMPLQEAPKNISAHGAKGMVEGVTLAVEGMGQGSHSKQSFQDSMSGGSDQQNMGSSKDELASITAAPVADAKMNAAKGFAVTESAATTTTDTANQATGLHGKIMQHASMMLKEGGGSMRMNVEHPGMGKIDLAINLKDNQLDVRILTPNDHVRDIINKELSGLRDGLGQQGISLRTVEVGNTSQSSNQFSGGRFGQGNNGQQASYNEMKEYAQSFAGSFNPRGASSPRVSARDVQSTIPNTWMNSARSQSRINVRI